MLFKTVAIQSLAILLLNWCATAKILGTTDHMLEKVTESSIEHLNMMRCLSECYGLMNHFDTPNVEPLIICGSDGRTYVDEHHFYCAVQCGRDVSLRHFGPCNCVASNNQRFLVI